MKDLVRTYFQAYELEWLQVRQFPTHAEDKLICNNSSPGLILDQTTWFLNFHVAVEDFQGLAVLFTLEMPLHHKPDITVMNVISWTWEISVNTAIMLVHRMRRERDSREEPPMQDFAPGAVAEQQ